MFKKLTHLLIRSEYTLPILLVVLGLGVIALAAAADVIGIGSAGSGSLGPAQIRIMLAGGVFFAAGLLSLMPFGRSFLGTKLYPGVQSLLETRLAAVLDDVLGKVFLLAVGCVAALFFMEIVLRIYSPFMLRLKGNMLDLPKNIDIRIENPGNIKLDQNIAHSKNSLGFRGEDPPINFNDYVTIIAVGGSTTECYYLSDGNTWIDQLGDRLEGEIGKVWVNNAGFDGHSTFGHKILMID